MPAHELRFGQGAAAFQRPTCFTCGLPVGLKQWIENEECPGRPMCEPPAIHIFLDGKLICECGDMDHSFLVDAITGKPISEVIA